jgi:hypothetical protein
VVETEAGDRPVGTIVSELTGLVDGEPVVRWQADTMFEKREVG